MQRTRILGTRYMVPQVAQNRQSRIKNRWAKTLFRYNDDAISGKSNCKDGLPLTSPPP